MHRPWQIDLLGGLRIRGDDRTITRFRTHKTGVLLAYLAFHLKLAHSREELAEMLWPESEPSAGRLNLRVELASLRRLLEPPGVPQGGVLLTSHADVQLNPRAMCTDVAALEAAIREAERTEDRARQVELLRHTVELYRGELLPGYCEDWILPERSRLADLNLAALRELSRLLHESGHQEGAIEAAHQAVAADPLSEEAHLDLMRLYTCSNRPVDALHQYRTLEQTLREQLGATLSAAARALAEELQQSAPTVVIIRSTPPVDAPPPARASPPSPHQSLPRLPLTFTRFFGRKAELARLEELLLRAEVFRDRSSVFGPSNNTAEHPTPNTQYRTPPDWSPSLARAAAVRHAWPSRSPGG
jgi:DNA-binding SARP family transcriptional activator